MIESFLYSMQVDLLTQDSLMFESVTNSGEDLRPWIQEKGQEEGCIWRSEKNLVVWFLLFVGGSIDWEPNGGVIYSWGSEDTKNFDHEAG